VIPGKEDHMAVYGDETTTAPTGDEDVPGMGSLRASDRRAGPLAVRAGWRSNPSDGATRHHCRPTLSSFTYTLTFVGFVTAYITITGP
jgi:hypothetical protein